eukprot:GEMP01025778.1.p1 GENE.GEMP01025778.1~~GEMP01025778.1.p1  ORF type:complete len:493 (+),score=100.39 GEMP01025778.1:19-1497(+)
MKLSVIVVTFAVVLVAFFFEPSWLSWVSLEELDDPVRKSTQTAWTKLKQEGIIKTSDVEVGNSLGLRLNSTVKEGHILMEVPDEFAFTGDSWKHLWIDDRAAVADNGGSGAHQSTSNCTDGFNCAEGNAVKAITEPTFYGVEPLVAEIATEFWIGDDSCKACQIIRPLLPTLDWISNHGLFSMAEEFPLLTHGTSMQQWFEMGTSVTNDVHKRLDKVFPGQLTIDQVRWAYIVTMMHSTRPKMLEQPTLLAQMVLARPTAYKENAPILVHDKESGSYKFLANLEMAGGMEFFAYDPTFSDASALCFRGLWFTRRHRMELNLNITLTLDAETTEILEKYECIGQGSSWMPFDRTKPSLRLFVTHHHRQIPKHFMSCLRLLAASKDGTDGKRLQVMETQDYMSKWPQTKMASQQIELKAAELALALLQKNVDAILSVNKEVRKTFGADNVAARPSTKVREAETMILVSLLKSMNELHVMASSPDLYWQLKARET